MKVSELMLLIVAGGFSLCLFTVMVIAIIAAWRTADIFEMLSGGIALLAIIGIATGAILSLNGL